MRSGKVIIGSVLVLAVTAALLLRTSPPPVADREIPVAEAPDSVVDSYYGRDSAVAKESLPSGPSSAADAATGADASVANRALGATAAKGIEAGQEKAYLKAAPLSKEEVKSVRKLVDVLFKNSRGKDSLNKMIRELRMNGLDPVMARDFNPYTGKMLTIRTNEALAGTRYIHAQYFEDSEKDKEPFRQHFSFEMRPSRDGMQVVQKIVAEKLGKKLGAPVGVRGDDWVEWKKDNDSIWVQRLGAEDLNNDRLNARTAEDVGTLRVAIETIPEVEHAHEAAGH